MNDVVEPARRVRAAGGRILCWLGCVLAWVSPAALRAEPPLSAEAHTEPTEYCNPRFCLHTDLPKEDAQALLKRLDCTLKSASRFFGAPPRDSIEAFVVRRLDSWPAEEFTHPAARLLIGGVGGGAVTNGPDEGATAPRRAIVFAAALPGIPEHEIVHAYCVQTFGQAGPTWFKEGVAEMIARGGQERAPVCCPDEVIAYLKSEAPRTMANVVGTQQDFTAPLAASLVTVLQEHRASDQLVDVASMDRWNAEHTEFVNAARREYHWCWAVCHFLNQHPACRDRFKQLARAYVNGQAVEFQDFHGPAADRLEFEFRFFVEHLENGYRVDLCAWDWQDSPKSKNEKPGQSARICACRGFQPTGFAVSAGDTVTCEATGEWGLEKDGPVCGAAGDAAGRGCLEAVVLHDFQLSEPFKLDGSGRFTAPATGQLYLRCQDDWGKLADNRGHVRVSLRRVGKK